MTDVLGLVVVSSRLLDHFLHPPAHPEQVGVEAVLPVAVAALAPGHDADLVPAVLCRVLNRGQILDQAGNSNPSQPPRLLPINSFY